MFHAELKSKEDEDICILVRPDNHSWSYICECGDASGLSVKDCQDTRAIFISHTHFDHFSNFDWIVRHQLGIEREVIICGPPDIARQVQSRLLSYTWNLINPDAISYQVREIVDERTIRLYRLRPPQWSLEPVGELSGNTILQEKQVRVDFTILDHKIPSIAYRFRETDTVKIDMSATEHPAGPWVSVLKDAYEKGEVDRSIQIAGKRFRAETLFHLLFTKEGDTLGVIMDHGAHADNHARIEALFSGCRKVFIECFFKNEDRELAIAHAHSYARESGRIMRLCQVPEAVPVHYSRKYEKPDIDLLKAEFEKAYLG